MRTNNPCHPLSAEVVERRVYDSFGNRVLAQGGSGGGGGSSGPGGPSGPGGSLGGPGGSTGTTNSIAADHLFGYTGREWDSDIGLQYNRARWYDPKQGRWISQDPIGFAAGDENLYRYVGNGPITFRDPTGFAAEPNIFLISPKGHHWVPWEVIKTNLSKLTVGGVQVSIAYTSGELDHPHNFGAYGGVKHSRYNEVVMTEFDKFYKAKKKDKLSGADMKEFADLIKSGMEQSVPPTCRWGRSW